MATMFGRFEVQSELSKSETALIYKVMDTETNQVVALKTQSLAPLGKRADAFVETLIREGESTRDLACQNIVSLFGAGEIEGQFCAAMEYIQGNSIASMLARKEGFSIWDLLDITRQLCAGLEHASSKNVTHCSLEPAKIMVQWDGTVKVLGYGISNMSLIEAEAGNSLGRLMPYCSPEQIRGEAIDLRSNLFTLGAILYEMVAGRKAFDATDPVTLVNQIENDVPEAPSSVNSKIQPGVSALIMNALAKDPAARYQTAGELLQELERCKENGNGNGKKAVPESARSVTDRSAVLTSTAGAASAGKFVAAVARPPLEAPTLAAPRPVTPAHALADVAARGVPTTTETRSTGGAMTATAATRAPSAIAAAKSSANDPKYNSKSGARTIGDFDVSSREYQAARVAVLSAPPLEQESARREPTVAVDPLMAKPEVVSSGKSFSDLAEMPPLKEPIFAPSVQEMVETPLYEPHNFPAKRAGQEEKLKIQPREAAQNAIRHIVTVPPRLILFSFLGAVVLILVILTALFFHVRSEDEDSTVASHPLKSEVLRPIPTPPEPQVQTPVSPAQIERPVPTVVVQPKLQIRQIKKPNSKSSRRTPAPAPVPIVIPGEVMIDSTPQGAQFQVDQKSDPSWVTPFTLPGLDPGKHTVVISKSGYSSETRSVEVFGGTKSSLALHLYPVNALMALNSTPAGANIIIDGKPTGRATPAQFAVEKGSHTVLLRKQGYLDETITADLSPAQNFQFSPQLRALGNTADMRTVGKLSKLFGRGDNTAGMGTISIHTQPKGAQVAINQSVLEKTSPVDVMLGPGNYIVDITLTGFKPVHKVVSVDKGDKVAVDQLLERQ